MKLDYQRYFVKARHPPRWRMRYLVVTSVVVLLYEAGFFVYCSGSLPWGAESVQLIIGDIVFFPLVFSFPAFAYGAGPLLVLIDGLMAGSLLTAIWFLAHGFRKWRADRRLLGAPTRGLAADMISAAWHVMRRCYEYCKIDVD